MSENAFVKHAFSDAQIEKYFKNALKDLGIAGKSEIPEVKFTYSYNSLLKAGITLIAKLKGMKIRAVPGHHIVILKTMGELLSDDSIFDVGNTMRMKRNTDLYDGGILISEKEALDYYNFVKKIIKKTESLLK